MCNIEFYTIKLAFSDISKVRGGSRGGEGGSSPVQILNSPIFLKLKSLGFA